MKPSESRVFAWLVIVFLAGCLASVVTYADDECRGHSCNGDVDVTTVLTGGDNTVDGSSHVSGSRSLALSNGMADVDIAGCLGSTQWATPLFSKQKLELNWPCMTEFYIRNQMWENAAMAICNTDIRKEFANEQACRDAHPFSVMATLPPETAEPREDDDEHEEYEQQFAMFQQQIQELSEQVNKPRVTRQVVQQPFLSEEKKALLRAEKSK